jgi:hypothetical protein
MRKRHWRNPIPKNTLNLNSTYSNLKLTIFADNSSNVTSSTKTGDRKYWVFGCNSNEPAIFHLQMRNEMRMNNAIIRKQILIQFHQSCEIFFLFRIQNDIGGSLEKFDEKLIQLSTVNKTIFETQFLQRVNEQRGHAYRMRNNSNRREAYEVRCKSDEICPIQKIAVAVHNLCSEKHSQAWEK